MDRSIDKSRDIDCPRNNNNMTDRPVITMAVSSAASPVAAATRSQRHCPRRKVLLGSSSCLATLVVIGFLLVLTLLAVQQIPQSSSAVRRQWNIKGDSVLRNSSGQEEEMVVGVRAHESTDEPVVDPYVNDINVENTKPAKEHGKQQHDIITTNNVYSKSCFRPLGGKKHSIINYHRRRHTHVIDSSLASPPSPPPVPYINLGFPKCGSTSLYQYFAKGGLYSSHWKCSTDPFYFCGHCIYDVLHNHTKIQRTNNEKTIHDNNNNNYYNISRLPLQSCGNYDVWAQLDISYFSRILPNQKTSNYIDDMSNKCYFPQIEALDAIHLEYPNATFLFTFRSMDKWFSSLDRWHDYTPRLYSCFYKNDVNDDDNEYLLDPIIIESTTTNNNNGTTTTDHSRPIKIKMKKYHEGLAQVFCDQVNRVRKFVTDHPSHALIEITLDDDDENDDENENDTYSNGDDEDENEKNDISTGEFLQSIFGIDETLWGVSNVGHKRRRRNRRRAATMIDE